MKHGAIWSVWKGTTMSGGEMSEWLGELRDLSNDLHHEAEQTGYGYFPGGDPNDFSPDPECSTEEERAVHKADCEKWNAGQRTGLTRTACEHHVSEDGKTAAILTPSGYGLGTYSFRDEQAAEIAERVDRIIGQVEAWARDHAADHLERD